MEPKLNPGVVDTVKWLNDNGFRTSDSGDGKTHDFECDLPIPYVHMVVKPEVLVSETNRLVSLLLAKGITVEPMNETGLAKHVTASYDPSMNLGVISMFNILL